LTNYQRAELKDITVLETFKCIMYTSLVLANQYSLLTYSVIPKLTRAKIRTPIKIFFCRFRYKELDLTPLCGQQQEGFMPLFSY